MANFNVNLHPNLVNLGTEGGLDSSVINGKSIQRTMHGLMIVKNGERKIVGSLTDEEQFNDVIEDVSDYQDIVGGTGPVWGALFDQDTESGDYFLAQSSDIDVDGNLYYASINPESSYNSQSMLRKFDPNGEVLWGKSIDANAAGREVIRARVANDGGIFLIYERIVRKLDSDGNEIWKFMQDDETWNTFNFVNCAEDSSGNLFVAGNGVYEGAMFFIIKFDSSGNLVEERQIYLNASDEYMAADMVIDSNDNVLFPLNMDLVDGAWSTLVVKLPNDLSEQTWQVVLSADYGFGFDADSIAFGIDSLDNVYVFGYYRFVTKINSSGEIVWCKDIEGNGMGVDDDGNSYVVEDSGSTLQVTKIGSDGELVWSYDINASPLGVLGFRGWNDEGNSCVFVNNNYLMVQARLTTDGPVEKELLLKLPLDALSGTFGDFVFTDNTENINLTTLSTTDNSENSAFFIYETTVLTDASEALPEATVSQEITLTSFEE